MAPERAPTNVPGRTLPRRRAAGALLALLSGLAAAPAGAQEDAAIRVELNKLEPAEGACQAYFVVENAAAADLERLNLDLVVFDPDGIVARRLAAEMGPLEAGRTRLRVFALDGLACGGVGRVLLNGVLDCRGAEGPIEGCGDRLELASRADAPFGD
jgi:hypothetical protein